MLMAVPRRAGGPGGGARGGGAAAAAAVVPYAATLGAAAARAAGGARVLLLGPAGAEFVVQGDGHPAVMRYLGPASAPPAFLAGELAPRRGRRGGRVRRRAAVRSPGFASGNGAARNGSGELLVWNDAGLAPDSVRAFGDTFGASFRPGEGRDLAGAAAAAKGLDAPAGYAAAASLALAGLAQGRGSSAPAARPRPARSPSTSCTPASPRPVRFASGRARSASRRRRSRRRRWSSARGPTCAPSGRRSTRCGPN
jgi:hypothetical protein